jgi:hypothetical protein
MGGRGRTDGLGDGAGVGFAVALGSVVGLAVALGTVVGTGLAEADMLEPRVGAVIPIPRLVPPLVGLT